MYGPYWSPCIASMFLGLARNIDLSSPEILHSVYLEVFIIVAPFVCTAPHREDTMELMLHTKPHCELSINPFLYPRYEEEANVRWILLYTSKRLLW